MKNLSIIFAVFLLAACSSMKTGDNGVYGSSDSGGNATGGANNQAPNMQEDLRSRDRAKDLYFG